MSHQLAIVIPAYRARFLGAALAALAAQTCRDFTVYVGDDASPDDLAAVCAPWAAQLDLRYHRFSTNLGGRDLVGQWERCLALSHEPWVWLPGDDDELEPTCVQTFLQHLAQHGATHDVFHFDVLRIDAAGQVLGPGPAFPAEVSALEFASLKLTGRVLSFAPEYVFARSALKRAGGFARFPLAWCADDATWVKLAHPKGIKTLAGPRVRWRESGTNISSYSPALEGAKFTAALQYRQWLLGQVAALAAPAQAAAWRQRLASEAMQWLFFNLPRTGTARWRAVLHTARVLGPDGWQWLLKLPRFMHWQRQRERKAPR